MSCAKCQELNKRLLEKIKECNELRERYKAISAAFCFTLSTDFD